MMNVMELNVWSIEVYYIYFVSCFISGPLYCFIYFRIIMNFKSISFPNYVFLKKCVTSVCRGSARLSKMPINGIICLKN